MEVLDVVLYIILTLILLALIGVLSWLIYDYFEYKKAVKSKINDTVAQSDDSNILLKKEVTTDYDNKFNIHNEYIKSTSNYIISDYDKRFSNTSNYILHTSNFLTSDYDKKFGEASNYILGTSNFMTSVYDNKFGKTSNYILGTSNYIASDYNNMFDNSSANLNKFFTFGLNNNNIANNKIRDRIWENADITNLELIRNTIAKSNLTAEKILTAQKGVKIQTNAGTAGPSSSTNHKGLELCNTSGELCWNLYVDGSGDLKAVKPNDAANNGLSFTTLATQISNSGAANSGVANSGVANSGVANSGAANSGAANSGVANSGVANSGVANSGVANSGVAPELATP
jgi:hypothetical protein